MKIKVYINDNGAIVANVDGKESIMFYLDTMCEFPEDACEQMAERLQELLEGAKPTRLSHERRDWPDDLKMVYSRGKPDV